MQLHHLLVVVVESDIEVVSSAVAVIFAITWVVNNKNVPTEPRFLDGTEPSLFQKNRVQLFSKTETKLK